MNQRDRLLSLIEDLYTAPGTKNGWLMFLHKLRNATSGSAAHFLSVTPQEQRSDTALTTVVDPEALRLYHEHWGKFDPWGRSPRLHALRHPTVILGDELISHATVKQTGYYFDFARQYDMVRCVVGMIETGPRTVSVISINRTERQDAFGNEEAALLRALMPHLQRGLQLHRRLLSSEALSNDLAALVDFGTHAVILVNAAGRITFVNRAASRLMASRDGLTMDAEQLCAARAGDTTRLRTLVAAAVRTSNGDGLGAGGTLAVGRPSGRRPLAVLVCPMSRQRTRFFGVEAAALVFVTDPEQVALPDQEMLRALFGLTPAEAMLTRHLADGCSLTEAAARLGLRRKTVRSRLKMIFEKTNTHGQAEPVRLVLCETPRI